MVAMQRDAEVIVALRGQYYLGYALRALALCELNELDAALSDHNRALELCDIEHERPALFHQRQETHWRLGNLEAARTDARSCVQLDPKSVHYRASLAKILCHLGLHEQAKLQLSHITQQKQEQVWLEEMSQYMSDTCSAGKTPKIPEHILSDHPSSGVLPSGYLLPPIADLFRNLQGRATRLVGDSHDVSAWAPDGKQLAYTRSQFSRWDDKALSAVGTAGSKGQGIEIMDVVTGRKRVLTTFGARPTWSSDGRFIAFEHSAQVYRGSEDIWLVPAQGGTPQRLAAGNCPCWTDHPSRLYYVSPADEMIYVVDVNRPTESRTPVAPCRGQSIHMQVSPDGRYLAFASAGRLTILELHSHKVCMTWVAPGPQDNFVRWSPDGKKVSLGVGGIQRLPSGLWIFDIERKQGRHVLNPMTLSCNWSPDGSRVALDLSYPVNEIWLAEVDPDLPTWEVFGGGQSRADYLQRYWERDSQFYQTYPFAWKVFLRSVCSVAIDQYKWAEYSNALWTLEHLAMLPGVEGTQLEIKILAYLAMTLAKLERFEEGTEKLQHLRFICSKGKCTDETSLYEAERILATQDSSLLSIWESIQDNGAHQALGLVRAYRPTTVLPGQAEAAQSARSALARKYCLSAQATWHQGQVQQTATHYENALRADPNHIPSLRRLAYLLATCADSILRDGEKAKSCAQRACMLTAHQDHACLAALAAAHANCGEFSDAVKWQQQALEKLPEGQSNHELLGQLRRYESHQGPPVNNNAALVAWWPFTAADMKKQYTQDASGLGLRGVYQGNAHVVLDPQRGHVLSFDGQGDWVECSHHPRFNFVDEITVSVWVKVKTFGFAHQAIIVKGNTWSFSRLPFGNMVGFGCVEIDVPDNPWGILVGKQNLADGQWHHLSAVYDGTTVYQYVDAKLDASAPARGKLALSDRPLYLGKCVDFEAEAYQGLIDDVRIYNRSLNISQIKALYDGLEPPAQDE